MTSPNTTTGRNFTYYNQGTNSHQADSHHNNLTKEEMLTLRKEYYRIHYDEKTGLRIAGTLGGFFLFVLLTLWYKSKCKKHSRSPSPVPPPELSLLPSIPIRMPRYGGGESPSSSSGDDDRLAMLDPSSSSSHFINMNQIHPYNNHYPRNNTQRYVNSPALLLTTANSDSSEEEEEDLTPTAGFKPLFPLNHPTIQHLNPGTLSPTKGQNQKGGRMKWLEQNIDIHVILPTPTISPSGSEHFCTRDHPISPLLPSIPGGGNSISRRGSGSGGDRDRSSSVGSTSYTGGGVFFLDNLKYVDDTSSENIPTIEDQDQDTRSIGSDSVFAGFEHNFDHVAPGYGRRISSVSGYGPGKSGPVDEESDFKLTLTQAQAQVHHRDSFCSEVESVNDYLESNRRRSSSTQTTFSDLQQCLSLSCSTGGGGNNNSSSNNNNNSGMGGCSPRLSPRPLHIAGGGYNKSQLGPRQVLVMNPGLLTVGPGPTICRLNYPRKRSFEGLRKTHSLQCDEPISCGSSSSCTATNKSPGAK